MIAPPGHGAAVWLLLAGWVVLLALLPWWLGLALLILLAAAVVYYAHRSASLAESCGTALKWGLPGCLFAVQRALGGDLLAWGAALLGALVGFSLVALLESLLFRRHAPAPKVAHAPSGPMPEWKDMAMAPIGPPGHIIELERPDWQEAQATQTDSRGRTFGYETETAGQGIYRFEGGRQFEGLSARYTIGPHGRWFVANLPKGEGNLLYDRRTGRAWRLRHWQLCGWEDEMPWLSRQVDGVPVPLHEVLGQPAD
ncbi:hypothetical protein EYV96_08995 [Dyella terrae]|uniref:Uncharacterized protein n=3 Tax=Dyella TaxID=231454 RepID=A0A4R0YXN9_9GAMM|nr:hypothetical protein [Dyella soli]TBR40763.1 hypothetical protein EYV96_08995 [Dyella terrae]TCI12139.1 hypothetical protein EZM97_01875 [Dyella soli]